MERRAARRLAPRDLVAALVDAGVPMVREREAAAPAGAAAAAGELGFPVVLKARGLDHKSDAGGVVLDLRSADEVRVAAERLLAEIGPAAAPFVVQQQRSGFELLVGVRRSGRTGATVVVGHGGIHVEVWRDTAEAVLPLGPQSATALLAQLRCFPLLVGHRGSPKHDLAAAGELVERVAAFAESHPEIVELDLNPVLVGAVGQGAVAVDVRATLADADGDDAPGPDQLRPVDAASLSRLFDPRHVVVVGVSDDPAKTGARIFGHVVGHGFSGQLDAVHPTGGAVAGRTRYPTLAEVPGTPDVVSIAVPAEAVLEVARQAVAKGAGGVIVHGGGFKEAGAAGTQRQRELATLLAEADVALLGPNSMGVVSPHRNVAISLSGGLAAGPVRAGNVAVLSTSGALGSCLATRLLDTGTGLSRWIHVGNEAGVDLAATLEWLADDEHTDVVALIVEHITDGARFRRAGEALRHAGKPVFAYGLARTSKGHAAVQSHTGAMVGPFAVREAVMRAAGVLPIASLRALEDVVALTARLGLPRGPRLGAITASGGACTIIADAVESSGLELVALAAETNAALAELVPGFAGVSNPIDMTAELLRSPERFGQALEVLVRDPGLDLVLVQFTTNADPGADATARAVIECLEHSPIPVYVSRFGAAHTAPLALQRYREAGLPLLDAPDRAVEVLGSLVAVAQLSGDRP